MEEAQEFRMVSGTSDGPPQGPNPWFLQVWVKNGAPLESAIKGLLVLDKPHPSEPSLELTGAELLGEIL